MKTFYAINLNGKYNGLSRWSLYEMTANGMDVVWPKRKDEKDIMKRDLLPHQVFKQRPANGPDKWPAYHFTATGGNVNHIDEIADGLAQHFKEDVTIQHLHGHSPSLHTAEYRKAK